MNALPKKLEMQNLKNNEASPSVNTFTYKFLRIIITTTILTIIYAFPADKDALSYYDLIIQSLILAFSSSLGIFYIIPFSFQALKRAKQSYILDSPFKTIAYALIVIVSMISWYWITDSIIQSITGYPIEGLYHSKSPQYRYRYSKAYKIRAERLKKQRGEF